MFGLKRVYFELKKILSHSVGLITPIAKDCVPEKIIPRMIWTSRIYIAIILITIFTAFYLNSLLPNI